MLEKHGTWCSLCLQPTLLLIFGSYQLQNGTELLRNTCDCLCKLRILKLYPPFTCFTFKTFALRAFLYIYRLGKPDDLTYAANTP